ncbi:MAG: ferritin-like domain-containing protein [Deltaproteobacteria bacterium]|nr:MAG: ferritin-like domain-containing protein [Deltaproteobacteria bacterium]
MDSTQREIITYSYYRDAELRGANLLFLLLRIADDPESQVNLTQHISEETRHAWLWTERIQELGAHPIRVDDGYQVRIGKKVGRPRDVVDLFALTVVVEQRALRRYVEHMRKPDTPPRTLEVLKAVTKDEGWHVDWIRQKARELGAARGEPDRFEKSLERFRLVDKEVTADLDAKERELFG